MRRPEKHALATDELHEEPMVQVVVVRHGHVRGAEPRSTVGLRRHGRRGMAQVGREGRHLLEEAVLGEIAACGRRGHGH